MASNPVPRIISAYAAVSIALFLAGYFWPAHDELFYSAPIIGSVLLLIPIYIWQKNHCRKHELLEEVSGKNMETTLFWIFALFLLALAVRIPSVLLFYEPYEKTPLIYLLILTMILVDRTNPRVFGLKTQNLKKGILQGLVFFIILGGLAEAIYCGIIYGYTGQISVQSFDLVSSLLSLPFMIFCVGISEEGLFRGYIQTHLEKLCNPGIAILLQAILFGFWHFVWNLYPQDLAAMAQYVATTFLFGLLFGYLYYKTKSLVPVVLAHGLWNSVLPWIMLNDVTLRYFATFPALTQVLASVIPFIISGIAAVIFIKSIE